MSLNLIVTQTPLVGEISTAMQTHPEVQQVMAQAQAVEEHKHDRQHVQKSEKKDASKSVDPEGGQSGSHFLGHKHERKHDDKPPEDEKHASPWAGNIIDMKI